MCEDPEGYTCELYGQNECRDVYESRYTMFKTGSYADNCLPPNKDSLNKHIQHTNYQDAIYKRSFEKELEVLILKTMAGNVMMA